MGVGRRRRISKADGKIVGADKQDIWQDGDQKLLPRADAQFALLTNAVNRSNVFDILYSVLSLDLEKNTDTLVCRVQVLRCCDSPAPMSEWTSESASASRRESTIGYDLLCFLCSRDLEIKEVLRSARITSWHAEPLAPGRPELLHLKRTWSANLYSAIHLLQEF
jgi:hypothetical protein